MRSTPPTKKIVLLLPKRFTKVLKANGDAFSGSAGVFGMSGGGGYGGRNDKRAISVRLNAELPDVVVEEISRHEAWFRQRGLFIAKKKIENKVREPSANGFYLVHLNLFEFQFHMELCI